MSLCTTYRILYFYAQFLNIPVFINLVVHYVLNHHMRDDLIHNVLRIVQLIFMYIRQYCYLGLSKGTQTKQYVYVRSKIANSMIFQLYFKTKKHLLDNMSIKPGRGEGSGGVRTCPYKSIFLRPPFPNENIL